MNLHSPQKISPLIYIGGTVIVLLIIVSVSFKFDIPIIGQLITWDNNYDSYEESNDDAPPCTNNDDCPPHIECESDGIGTVSFCDDATNKCKTTPTPCNNPFELKDTPVDPFGDPKCGDGVIQPSKEECDGGDGCSKKCKKESRCVTTDDYSIALGICAGSDEWDEEDGKYHDNNTQYDQYNSWLFCKLFCTSCGNGILEDGEECDDGRHCKNGDSCTSNTSSICQTDNSECKPRSFDGCSEFCNIEQCGNGVIDEGEECDNGKHCENGVACDSYYCAQDNDSECIPRDFDGCSEYCEIESWETLCEYELVNGIVRRCCQEEYNSETYNCSNFSENFHKLCYEEKLECLSIAAICDGDEIGHMFNIASIGDQWCLVEPQGTGIFTSCFDDPQSPDQEALCKAMNREVTTGFFSGPQCPCIFQIFPVPITPNTDPSFCIDPNALEENNYEICMNCCSQISEIMNINEDWTSECEEHCQNIFGDTGNSEY